MRTPFQFLVVVLSLALLAACGSSSGGGGGTPSYVEPGMQTATLEVVLTTLAVTVPTQPTNLMLAPQGLATWAGSGNPLSFDLGITNNYGRILFNIKPTVDSTNDAGAAPMGDGMYDGKPFFYWGHMGLDLGASRSNTITIDNVTISGTLTIEMTIYNHPMMFGTAQYYSDEMRTCDSSGTNMQGIIPEFNDGSIGSVGYASPGSTSGYSNGQNGVITSDSRYIYWGCRNQPAIVRADTITMSAVVTTDLTGNNNIKHDESGTGSIGFVRGVCMSADEQFLYAVLSTGGHQYEGVDNEFDSLGMTLELVKVRRSDMSIVSRAVVLSNVDEVMGSRPHMSADGSLVAFCTKTDDTTSGNPATVRAQVFVVTTATMNFVTHDLSADTASVGMVALSPDGTEIYYTARDDSNNALHRYVRASGVITEFASTNPSASAPNTRDMRWIGGLLYVCGQNGLHVYDPNAGTYTQLVANDFCGPMQVALDQQSIFLQEDNGDVTWHFAIPAGTPINAPATGASPIDSTNVDNAHAFIMTHR